MRFMDIITASESSVCVLENWNKGIDAESLRRKVSDTLSKSLNLNATYKDRKKRL